MHRWSLLLLLFVMAPLGCRSGAYPSAPSAATETAPLPSMTWHETTRRELFPDFRQLPDANHAYEVEPPTLWNLTEHEAQCAAAAQSPLANLLNREAEAVSQSRDPRTVATAGIVAELLQLEAIDQRNRSSAAALKLLLSLAEAEMASLTISQSLIEVRAMLGEVDALLTHQLLAPVSRGEIETQRLELLHRQIETEQLITQLNHELSRVVGTELPRGTQLWPDVSLAVSAEVPDRDSAVQSALNDRSDLIALRTASAAHDPAAIAVLLRAVNPALGISQLGSGRIAFGCTPPNCCEVGARDDQIRQVLRDRESAVTMEVVSAIDLIERRLAQIAITRQQLDAVNAKRVSAEKQAELAPEARIKVRQARLELHRVRQDLLHDVIAWRLAQLQLREAQGSLAKECGFDAAACWDTAPHGWRDSD